MAFLSSLCASMTMRNVPGRSGLLAGLPVMAWQPPGAAPVEGGVGHGSRGRPDPTSRMVDMGSDRSRNAVAPTPQPIGADAFGPAEGTLLWWLGGAGFLLNSRGTLVAVDPAVS